MFPRSLTNRERAVLNALLDVNFDGVERLRAQAEDLHVMGGCECGCPSINFFAGPSNGMSPVVNAGVTGSETFDGLFLFTVDMPGAGEVLGGIEWVSQGDADPDELPDPTDLTISLAAG